MTTPYIFDEFFASGQEESISPFLKPSSRPWGKNISLKSAGLAAFALCLSFTLSFFQPNASHLLLAFVYLLVGTPALLNALEDLKHLEINIDVLMTLAALFSIVIGSGMEGALLLVLFELSAAIENTVTQKTKSALYALKKLCPKIVITITPEGALLEKPIQEVLVGTQILIKAGEMVPLDGMVSAGNSFVNLKHLTGESLPAPKAVGDFVPAGAHNLDGSLTLTVNKTNADSTVSRIIALITQAQEAKPKIQKLFDQFGKWYSMAIIGLSVLFALSFPWLLSLPFLGEGGSVYRALTFLIAASPCALIIATPTAYLSAISSCAKKGIILKGGAILDALAKCSTIAFDKTGTLTSGNLTCTHIQPLNETIFSKEIALSVAAGLEKHATHPISKAILTLADGKKVFHQDITDFKSIAGFGLQGTARLAEKTYPVFIGHPEFIKKQIPHYTWQDSWQLQNTFLLIDQSLYAFHFEDELRPESCAAVSSLSQTHSCILLTGDHTQHAQVVAKALNISSVFANLRPEDKLQKVAEFSKTNGLIMVGDGINDAPALARATVGISMGKIGSASAIDASDIIFLKDDLSLLKWLINKASHTMRTVKQNLFLALGVIAFASIPALLGYIPLWLAVILHEGGTVIVGLNSLRLLKK